MIQAESFVAVPARQMQLDRHAVMDGGCARRRRVPAVPRGPDGRVSPALMQDRRDIWNPQISRLIPLLFHRAHAPSEKPNDGTAAAGN